MTKYAAGKAEVHLEPQTETTLVTEPKVQGEEQNQAPKRNKQKRTDQSRAEQNKESEGDKAFISDESYSFLEGEFERQRIYRREGFWQVHLALC